MYEFRRGATAHTERYDKRRKKYTMFTTPVLPGSAMRVYSQHPHIYILVHIIINMPPFLCAVAPLR